MASLILTFSELYVFVDKFLGTYGSSGSSGSALTDCKDIVHSAYRKFLAADGNHVWSFLKPWDVLITTSGTWVYPLPEDFVDIISPFSYDTDNPYPPLMDRPVEMIMNARAVNTHSKYPEFYALRRGPYSKETGQTWEILLYPTPDSAYTLNYQYKIIPKKLEGDNDIPIGGPEHSELLKEMCLAEAEGDKDEAQGIHTRKASDAMTIAINNDMKKAPHNLGYNGDGYSYSVWDLWRGDYRTNNVAFISEP